MVLWPIRARVPFELFHNVIFTTIGSNVTISLANLPLSNTDNTDSVRMNIFVDKSTDRAKPLSICQVAKGKNRVRYYKVKMINKFSHFLNED